MPTNTLLTLTELSRKFDLPRHVVAAAYDAKKLPSVGQDVRGHPLFSSDDLPELEKAILASRKDHFSDEALNSTAAELYQLNKAAFGKFADHNMILKAAKILRNPKFDDSENFSANLSPVEKAFLLACDQSNLSPVESLRCESVVQSIADHRSNSNS